MKVPARFLFGGATGMKDGSALVRRDARQLQFLECAGGHSRDLRPMLDDFGRQATCFADFPVGRIVLELESEQFEGQFGELPIANRRLPIGNRLAQARGEG